jgi:hypothetical protein
MSSGEQKAKWNTPALQTAGVESSAGGAEGPLDDATYGTGTTPGGPSPAS